MRGNKFLQLLHKKRAAMEIEEIVKLIIAVVVFIVLLAGVILLLSGRGAEVLNGIKEAMRFGR